MSEHQKIIKEMESIVIDYQEELVEQYAFLVQLNKENQHLHDFNGVLIETIEATIKQLEYYNRLQNESSFVTHECDKHEYDWIFYPELKKIKYTCKICKCNKEIKLN